MSRRRKRLPEEPVFARIESLSHDGRGVAHLDGKATFIDGALPGEEVMFLYRSQRKKFDEGRACEVLKPSPDRVVPKCAHADICGGCSLQHMAPEAQIHSKQQVLVDNLERIGHVRAEQVLPPLTGPHWGYRHKARLGAKFVRKKGKVLVGFREKRTPYLAELTRCEVLHPNVGGLLEPMAGLIQGLTVVSAIPQIEVAVGDDRTVLIVRNLEPVPDEDLEQLCAFAEQHGLDIYLQPKGPESVTLLWPQESQLHYALPDYDLRLDFLPTDFTQINPEINRRMIPHALALLDVQAHETVLDLFCGLGNFTLPLARAAAEVTGVEGDLALVRRARANAERNGIDNVQFHAADLTHDVAGEMWAKASYDKILLDPPRSGAQEMIPLLARMGAKRIVYVSCHPGSLARDAGMLVNEFGYRLSHAGVMDMFPHTAHVESIALFEKG